MNSLIDYIKLELHQGFNSVRSNHTEIYEYFLKLRKKEKKKHIEMTTQQESFGSKLLILIGGYQPIRRLKGRNGHTCTYFNNIEMYGPF
jgi:hypothetical protein